MRETKFRAWHTQHGMSMPFTLGEIPTWDLGKGWVTLEEYDKNLDVMQYTGLKDKNGVEICEGDIVFNANCFGCPTSWGDATDSFPQYRLIVWDEDEAKFRWAFLEEGIRDRRCSGYSFVKNNADMFEVIGNIYENKELLDDSRSSL
jgi:uncharacterized phage protein (TIGR01671 family)